MATYKIISHDGGANGLYLTVSSNNVNVSTDSGNDGQRWVISGLSGTRQFRSRNNVLNYVRGNSSTGKCDVSTSGSDIIFVALESNRFRLQLASDTSKYLTADGSTSGSTVSWKAANNAVSQIWKFDEVHPERTLSGAVSWISNMIGKAPVDYPANGSTECVDLVKYYLNQYFGLSSLVQLGDGAETYKGVVEKFPNWFIRLDAVGGTLTLQPGDIVSMRGSAGHVALVKSVSGNTVVTADQGAGYDTVKSTTRTYPTTSDNNSYLYGAARPIF